MNALHWQGTIDLVPVSACKWGVILLKVTHVTGEGIAHILLSIEGAAPQAMIDLNEKYKGRCILRYTIIHHRQVIDPDEHLGDGIFLPFLD